MQDYRVDTNFIKSNADIPPHEKEQIPTRLKAAIEVRPVSCYEK